VTLREFDILGEEISDEETEEVVKKGDPSSLAGPLSSRWE